MAEITTAGDGYDDNAAAAELGALRATLLGRLGVDVDEADLTAEALDERFGVREGEEVARERAVSRGSAEFSPLRVVAAATSGDGKQGDKVEPQKQKGGGLFSFFT